MFAPLILGLLSIGLLFVLGCINLSQPCIAGGFDFSFLNVGGILMIAVVPWAIGVLVVGGVISVVRSYFARNNTDQVEG